MGRGAGFGGTEAVQREKVTGLGWRGAQNGERSHYEGRGLQRLRELDGRADPGGESACARAVAVLLRLLPPHSGGGASRSRLGEWSRSRACGVGLRAGAAVGRVRVGLRDLVCPVQTLQPGGVRLWI